MKAQPERVAGSSDCGVFKDAVSVRVLGAAGKNSLSLLPSRFCVASDVLRLQTHFPFSFSLSLLFITPSFATSYRSTT